MWMYILSDSQRMTSGMLAHLLVQRTLNKQLFGICLRPACLVRIRVQMWTRLKTFTLNVRIIFKCRIHVLFTFRCKPGFRYGTDTLRAHSLYRRIKNDVHKD